MCPWNSPKLVQITGEPDYLSRVPGLPDSQLDPGSGTHQHPHAHTGPSTDSPSLIELTRMTREEWDRWTRGSAIRRAGYAGFRRNVAVAMGNWVGPVAEPPEDALAVLRDALEDEDPVVWARGVGVGLGPATGTASLGLSDRRCEISLRHLPYAIDSLL